MEKQKKRSTSGVMRLYRIGRKFYQKKQYRLSGIISKLIRVVFACDLPMTCDIEETAELMHNGLGVVIHEKAKIGKGSRIYQNVTIGGRNDRGYPTIGENVFVGCGACVLGNVHIGDGARIGANSVVLSDIPANATAVGVPAKVVKINTQLISDVLD